MWQRIQRRSARRAEPLVWPIQLTEQRRVAAGRNPAGELLHCARIIPRAGGWPPRTLAVRVRARRVLFLRTRVLAETICWPARHDADAAAPDSGHRLGLAPANALT